MGSLIWSDLLSELRPLFTKTFMEWNKKGAGNIGKGFLRNEIFRTDSLYAARAENPRGLERVVTYIVQGLVIIVAVAIDIRKYLAKK